LFKFVSFKERGKDSKYFAKLFKTAKKIKKSLFLAGFFLLMQFFS
jgi:hypothetical protein